MSNFNYSFTEIYFYVLLIIFNNAIKIIFYTKNRNYGKNIFYSMKMSDDNFLEKPRIMQQHDKFVRVACSNMQSHDKAYVCTSSSRMRNRF